MIGIDRNAAPRLIPEKPETLAGLARLPTKGRERGAMEKTKTRNSKSNTLAARARLRDRDYTDHHWDNVKKGLKKKLIRFYPDKTELEGATLDQQSNEWAGDLVDRASQAFDHARWLRLMTSRAQLKAEHADLLNSLKDAHANLDHLSRGMRRLLANDLSSPPGADANVSGCSNNLRELIQRIDAVGCVINRLPKAKTIGIAQHEAAVEMAIVVLHALKGMGISTAATVATGQSCASNAIQILQIIGNGLGLPFAETTWRDIIRKAKPLLSLR